MRIDKEVSVKRPGWLLRIFFRAPVVLFRLGLGSLMAWQILLITIGRRTGQQYKVVVDVMEHDKPKDTYYISAAYGPRSDWYLNLKAHPIVQAQVGRRKFRIKTTTLPQAEAYNILVKFVQHHPLYVSVMMGLIGVRIGWTEKEMRNLASKMPVIACSRLSFT